MENNINLKKLWEKQSVPVADWSDVLRKINRFKKNRIQKKINIIIILMLTIGLASFIWIYFEPQLIVTKIGIILSVASMGIATIFNYKLILLYKMIDERQTNSNYLNNLLTIKKTENFMQTKVLNLYFILLSTGIGLYMYEYAWTRSVTFGVIAYLVLFFWVGLNWFFLRPRTIEKSNRKFEDLIVQIKTVKSQIEQSNESKTDRTRLSKSSILNK